MLSPTSVAVHARNLHAHVAIGMASPTTFQFRIIEVCVSITPPNLPPMTWTKRPTTRSIRCQSHALKRHRTRRGWTQEELASLAGVSVRLVAKVEGGEPVHPDSIETLAAAVSTAKHPVFPEDLVFSPKDAARAIIESYARHERQCVAHCQHLLGKNMSLFAAGDPELFPFAGERQTIDGFDDFWGKFFSVMERLDKRIILDSMRLVAEDNTVVVLTNELATHRAIKVDDPDVTPITFLFEFERGKLVRFEDHFDPRPGEAKIGAILQSRRSRRRNSG